MSRIAVGRDRERLPEKKEKEQKGKEKKKKDAVAMLGKCPREKSPSRDHEGGKSGVRFSERGKKKEGVQEQTGNDKLHRYAQASLT